MPGRGAELVAPAPDGEIADRVGALAWARIRSDLDEQGWAKMGPLLAPAECADLAALYAEDDPFRSRVVMARHGFGQGEYRYFRYPLPETIAALRQAVYSPLAEIANRWGKALGEAEPYPPDLERFLMRCHAAGQARPTPLLLKYGAGDYNRLHQDLYGPLAFPLQLTIVLSEPGRDFTGGEFVLVAQKPRSQSQAHVVSLGRGEAVVFAVRHFPARGGRGFYRSALRHGVSRLHTGSRFALGIIFHDAS